MKKQYLVLGLLMVLMLLGYPVGGWGQSIKVEPNSVTIGTISPAPDMSCFARNRYVPINTGIKYSRTQIIYPAEKLHLPAGVRIKGLRFFPCSGSWGQKLSGAVYIKEITRDEKKELVSNVLKSEIKFYEWDKLDYFTILDGEIPQTEWYLTPNEYENIYEYGGGDLLIEIDNMFSTIADGLYPQPIDFQVEYVMHKDVEKDLLENDVIVLKGGWSSYSDKESYPTDIRLDYHVYPVINIEYEPEVKPVLGWGNAGQMYEQSYEPGEIFLSGEEGKLTQLSLRNKGNETLQIDAIQVEGTGIGVSNQFDINLINNSLQQYGNSVVELSSQIMNPGSYSGTLNIRSNGGNVNLPVYVTTYKQKPYNDNIIPIEKEPIPEGIKAVTLEGRVDKDLNSFLDQLSSRIYIDLSRVDITGLPEYERLYPKIGLPEAQRLSLPVGMKAVYRETFQGGQSLKRLQLPVGLKFIGEEAFSSLQNLETLICLGSEPPIIAQLQDDMGWDKGGGFPFSINLPELATIYVPENAIEQYKNAPGWESCRDRIQPLTQEIMEDTGDPIDGDLPDLEIVYGSEKYTESATGGNKIDVSFDVHNISSTVISDQTLRATLFRWRSSYTQEAIVANFSLAPQECKTITFKDVEIPSGETNVDFTIGVNEDGSGYYSFPESDKTNNSIQINIKLEAKKIAEADYAALCSFYYATGGENWNNKWTISENKLLVDNWNGVTFDDDGYVKKISLDNNNLTGTIPPAIFALSRLEEISLSNNNLSGELDEIMKTPSKTLQKVVLSKNPLTGILPSLVSWTKLTDIELVSCKLDSVSVPVPVTVTVKVFPQDMGLPDHIDLRRDIDTKLPAIAKFEENQKHYLSDFPDLNVRRGGSPIVAFKYDKDQEKYMLNSASYPLKLTSDDNLDLAVEGGSKDHRTDFELNFVEGDANIDGTVGVDDAVTTVNYILGVDNESKFFNYTATNVYPDDAIDIQDVVDIIGIVLNSSVPENRSRLKSDAPNSLSVENGKLVLDATVPVASLDVSLKGVSEKQLKPLLDGVLFTSRTTADGCRFILLDINGGMLPAGRTEIAAIATTEGRIQAAMLVDGKAEVIPVSLRNSGMPTGNEELNLPDDFDGRSIFVPDGTTDLTVTIYNLAGQPLFRHRWPNPQAGLLNLAEHLNALQPGAYILSRRMQVANKIVSKNNKLIIK